MRTESLAYPVNIPHPAYYVWSKLRQAGYQCLLAGGWVRDLWMGHPSQDVDIATSASPEQVMALFDRCLPLGQRFGSVIILIQEGQTTHSIEVTSFRQDGDYLDGRRPSYIRPADAQQDAERRDFTLNGLFFDPQTQQIIDWVGGIEDIEKRLVRAIGKPRLRFEEDKLRMLRAVRFATRFGFRIDPKTRQAIIDHASTLMSCVSVERIWQELAKMYESGHLVESLAMLSDVDLLQAIFELQLRPEEVKQKIGPLTQIDPSIGLVRLLAALWTVKDDGLPSACWEKIEQLKISKDSKKTLEHLDQGLKLYSQDKETYDRFSWVQWLLPDDSLKDCLWIAHACNDLKWLSRMQNLQSLEFTQIMKREKALIRTCHLEMNVQPGPHLGKLLSWLHEQAARLNITDRRQLLLHLKSHPDGLQLLNVAKRKQHK